MAEKEQATVLRADVFQLNIRLIQERGFSFLGFEIRTGLGLEFGETAGELPDHNFCG